LRYGVEKQADRQTNAADNPTPAITVGVGTNAVGRQYAANE